MPRRKKKKKTGKSRGRGAESPDKSEFPGLPPKNNVGRCKKCQRMLGVCLIEISRSMPSSAVVMRRAYVCRAHTAEIAEELVKEMSSWTTWIRDEDIDDIGDTDDNVAKVSEEPEELVEENDDG